MLQLTKEHYRELVRTFLIGKFVRTQLSDWYPFPEQGAVYEAEDYILSFAEEFDASDMAGPEDGYHVPTKEA